jgi:hypothetical protein
MIEGIRIEVSSQELKDHLNGMVKYHAEKAGFYLNQAAGLQAADVSETGHSNDPVGSLKSSARGHANKRDFFNFLAEHVIPNETYRLSHADLGTLEFIASLY